MSPLRRAALTLGWCAALVGGRAAPQFLYSGSALKLDATGVTDSLRTIHLEDLPLPTPACPLRLSGEATPFAARLWLIGLRDVESNIIDRPGARFFGAGRAYKTRVFTRDVAFSGILALDRLYPDLVLASLKFTRQEMFAMGLHVPAGYAAPEVSVPWQPPLPADASAQYPIGPFTRRTDDVVWLWCADDLLSHEPKADWGWMIRTGDRCFEDYYHYLYDPTDGLYRAQAAFVDIHYPDRKASGYPLDWTVGDCIAAKPLSTNCLYVLGLRAMAHACERTGDLAAAKGWRDRADLLAAAIRRELGRPDGTFAYLKDRHGALQPRRDALGSALVVLSGVVAGDAARAALRGYPVSEKGVPMYDPFFPFAKSYHNNTAWPFVDTFFLWAKEKAEGKSYAGLNAALLARTCTAPDYGFREYVDWRTGQPSGSSRQLWSAASYLHLCLRNGLVVPPDE